jgi:hypothetical protein
MPRCLLAIVLVLAASHFADAQTYRKILVSAAKNIRTPDEVLEGKDITPDCPHAWSLRKTTLRGGKQDGVELLILDNGKMRITVIPTRGMGILNVAMGDLRLGWDSPIKEVVHPQFMNLQARAGLGWLEGFNEWLVRCGLENVGQPGTDEFIDNTGEKSTMELTVHGKIANIPASEVELIVEKQSPYRITLRGVIHERMLFGPNLELVAELSTEPGSAKFKIEDTVTNRGSQPQEFQVLYHLNYGKPLLEEGAKIAAPLKKVTPYNKNAAKDVASYDTFAAPKPGYVEQVYLMQPLADQAGNAQVLLYNATKSRGVQMRYSLKELPYLTLWKNTGAAEDGYVVGVEPGTSYPNHRKVERQAGRVPKLAAGRSHTMQLEFTLHDRKYWIDQTLSEFRSLQESQPLVVEKEPQKAKE